ncbi:MAG: ComF family protein [Lachnospiraceae bacterium]
MLKDLLYPPKCGGCKEIIPARTYVCDRCRKQLHYVHDPVCMICGKPLDDAEEEKCFDCQKTPHVFTQNRSVFVYDDLAKKMMYELKYHHAKEHAEFFGTETLAALRHWILALEVDGIVPVPLHPRRKRQRGYNQAELLAQQIGKACKIPVLSEYLVRNRATRPQKELNDLERKNNMKNAFLMVENAVQLNRVMLLDDIYTTGATLDAAAAVLKEHGTKQVYGLTVCIGRGF